jgi:hypothetical protein
VLADLIVFLTPPMPAQMNMPGHVMEMKDQTPPDELPEPQRMTGIGNSHWRLPPSRTPKRGLARD